MIPLDRRSKDILFLILQSKQPLFAKEIARRLGITPRMVHFSIQRIKLWVEERRIPLEIKPNFGIFIPASPQARLNIISELESLSSEDFLEANQRFFLITISLLMASDPIMIKQLGNRLKVSRTTIITDLQKVNEWLSDNHLLLKKRPKFGFQVEGQERDFREAVINLVLESNSKNFLLELCINPDRSIKKYGSEDNKVLQEIIGADDLIFLKKQLDYAKTKLQLQLSDLDYLILLLHLALAVSRSRLNKTVDFSPAYLFGIDKEQESLVIVDIINRMLLQCKVELKNNEEAFLTALLIAAQKNKPGFYNAVEKQKSLDLNLQIKDIVDRIITEVSNYLHPYLRADRDLSRNLEMHIRQTFLRLRMGIRIRNPLLEDIKIQYPYIYEVTQKSLEKIQASIGLHFPEEEIGYLSMHLGAAMERLRYKPANQKRVLIICVEGIATAWLLVSRIRAELPELEIVQVLSLLEFKKRMDDFKSIDAIVSTLPLELNNLPVISVNPFLNTVDIQKLKKELNLSTIPIPEQKTAQEHDEGYPLISLITPERIILKVDAEKWQEVVEKAAVPLVRSGAIEKKYIEAMKKIIHKFGPYAVSFPGVVLLHARPEDGVNELCMSLMTLNTPVSFGHPENDPVDVAVVIGAMDLKSHLRALRELVGIIADSKKIKKIRAAAKVQDVVEIISHS